MTKLHGFKIIGRYDAWGLARTNQKEYVATSGSPCYIFKDVTEKPYNNSVSKDYILAIPISEEELK